MSARCTYRHDVSGDRFDDLPGDEWHCPHEAFEDEPCCVFHAGPETVPTDSASDRLLDAATSERGPLRLIGAHLGSLTLEYSILGGPSNHPIDLRAATVEGDLSIRYATVERPLRFEYATFLGAVDMEDATLDRRVDFGHSRFEGRVSFRMADFTSWLDLRNVVFHGPVYARVARFRRGIYGIDAAFHGPADFVNARFDDVANFYRAEFHRGAVFDSTTFGDNAQFDGATFGAPAVKLGSETGSPRSRGETLEGVSLSLRGVTCERNLQVPDASIDGDLVFTDSELARDVDTTGLTAIGDGSIVDCTGTETVSGTVDTDGGKVTYNMTEADLGELDVTDLTSFAAFRFDATRFNGFDFGSYIRELAAENWRLHGAVSEAPPERVENLYLRAKNGANAVGETRAAAEFFIKEMRYRRAGHRRRVVDGSGIVDRARAATDWVSNAALEATCGYGERPFRPVVFSAAFILAFAGLYAVLDPSLAYPKPFGYVVFSAVNFVSIILGLPDVAGPVLSFVIAVEAFVGGFVIALFVFTLTRSISR